MNLNMNNKENILAMYERQLERILERIDPKQFGFSKKRRIHNKRYGAVFNLTPKNRELILKRYKQAQTEAIKIIAAQQIQREES